MVGWHLRMAPQAAYFESRTALCLGDRAMNGGNWLHHLTVPESRQTRTSSRCKICTPRQHTAEVLMCGADESSQREDAILRRDENEGRRVQKKKTKNGLDKR